MPRTRVASPTAAFHRALVPHLPELRGRAIRLCGNEEDAFDLTQDAVERALRFARQYAAGTNLRAWLHRILYSVFVSHYRRARRERAALARLAPDPCAWTSPDAPARPDGSLPLFSGCSRVLSGLPDGYEQVLWLVDVRDLSYRDASLALDLPLGTVMSRLHRARRMLAKRWPDPVVPFEGDVGDGQRRVPIEHDCARPHGRPMGRRAA